MAIDVDGATYLVNSVVIEIRDNDVLKSDKFRSTVMASPIMKNDNCRFDLRQTYLHKYCLM